MVRVLEEPHASSTSYISYRPTGVNRSMACFPVFACVVRLQVSNVPARDCRTTGVQAHLSCPV